MRGLLVAVALASGCGGEGKCAQPPCDIPEAECRSNADCFQSQFCNFAQNSCGTSPMDMGVCDNKPSECTSELDRVCGCDGKFHSNRCAAEQAGVDVSNAGGCPAPPGTFLCGAEFCDPNTQLCFKVKGSGQAIGCQPLPSQCHANPTCSCLGPAGDCDCTKDVGITVACPLDRPQEG